MEGNSGDSRPPASQPPPNFVRPKPGRTKPKSEEPKSEQPPTKAEQPQSETPAPKKRGRKPGSFTRNKKHLAARLKKEHDAREAYRLRYIEGKTLKEIAEALNRKSQGQLHTLIEEEKRRLRGAFTEDALDAFKFAKYEAVSLYGEARDNYILSGDPKHAAIANQALDKIIKLTVGYLPEKKEFSGELAVKVAVVQEEDWYGNDAHRLSAEAAAAPIAGAVVAGEVQDGSVRPALGQDGAGATGDG